VGWGLNFLTHSYHSYPAYIADFSLCHSNSHFTHFLNFFSYLNIHTLIHSYGRKGTFSLSWKISLDMQLTKKRWKNNEKYIGKCAYRRSIHNNTQQKSEAKKSIFCCCCWTLRRFGMLRSCGMRIVCHHVFVVRVPFCQLYMEIHKMSSSFYSPIWMWGASCEWVNIECIFWKLTPFHRCYFFVFSFPYFHLMLQQKRNHWKKQWEWEQKFLFCCFVLLGDETHSNAMNFSSSFSIWISISSNSKQFLFFFITFF